VRAIYAHELIEFAEPFNIASYAKNEFLNNYRCCFKSNYCSETIGAGNTAAGYRKKNIGSFIGFSQRRKVSYTFLL
jgi:hypothetical protein